MKGGAKVVVEKHRHEGIFVARGKEDALVTKNMVVGESVYGEKRISVDVRPPASVLFPRPRRDPTDARAKRFSSRRLGFPLPAAVPPAPTPSRRRTPVGFERARSHARDSPARPPSALPSADAPSLRSFRASSSLSHCFLFFSSSRAQGEDGVKTEYRVWNPFRSKVAAGILGGLDNIYIKPGTKLLYLGAAAGTTVSHCSDVVGPEGLVYAVEFSHRPGRDLVNMAKKRTNVIPIIEDARHPQKYRMLVGMVDTIFADVAQPDQARIVALNAQHFLKPGGNFIISIKANCIDSTVPAEAVFAREVKKLQQEQFKPSEQLTLEPYERDHAIVCGAYRVGKKKSKD